jgi:hypothetical protein
MRFCILFVQGIGAYIRQAHMKPLGAQHLHVLVMEEMLAELFFALGIQRGIDAYQAAQQLWESAGGRLKAVGTYQ